MEILDLKGQQFGRLTVLGRLKSDKWRQGRWLCKCVCGNLVKTKGSSLRSGHTKSCGCLHKDIVRDLFFKHGHATNGMTKTYAIWLAMLQRCNNSNHKAYKWYGGRGIGVCSRWNDFRGFLEDMGEKPDGLSLDRVENDGNYEPGNCKWATTKEQARNKRSGKLSTLKVQVIKKLLKESNLTQESIAEIFGVVDVTISQISVGKIWADVQY